MGHFGRMAFGVVAGAALIGGFGAAVPTMALAASSPAPAVTALEYGLSSNTGAVIVCYPTAVEYATGAHCG
jgi:hypothetical protein